MKQLLKEWIYFLSEERQEREIAGSADVLKEKIKTNKFFRDRFIRDFIKNLLIPTFRESFSQEEINSILGAIKDSKEEIKKTRPNFLNSIPKIKKSPLKIHKSENIYLKVEFSKYLEIFTQKIGGSVNRGISQIFIIYALYYMLFGELPKGIYEIDSYYFYKIYNHLYGPGKEEPPTGPILKRIGPAGDDYAEKNARKLKEHYDIDINPSDIRAVKILAKHPLSNAFGSGAYGKVFKLIGTNYVIKIFSGSVDLHKDLKRYKEMEEQLYSGGASLKDMHFFESGELGKDKSTKSQYYYAIMPTIIPLTKTEEYKKGWENYRQIFEHTLIAIKSWQLDTPDEIYDFIDSNYGGYVNDFSYEFVYKIIEAILRAREEFGGRDLHGGNIGYIPQRPDIFFFFDM